MFKSTYILFLVLFIGFIFSTDSDEDGYPDQLEVEIGTDPNNFDDRYYYGHWPYNPTKDQIKGLEFPIQCPYNISCECESDDDCINQNCQKTPRGQYYCMPKPGDIFPNLMAVDQYGELVEIYDFAMQGKIIVLEFGASWCSPCKQLANFLSDGNFDSIKKNRWWKDEYSIIKEKIDSGEIIFITVLFQNDVKGDASYETVSKWHELYPNEKIVVLADEYKDVHQWIKPTGYPCVNIIDDNMKLITSTTRGLSDAFDILSGLKPIPAN